MANVKISELLQINQARKLVQMLLDQTLAYLTMAAKQNIDQVNAGKQKDNDLLSAQFGENGFRIITSSSTLDAEERYYFIQATQDKVIDCTNNNGGDNSAAFTLLAGLYLTGVFSAVVVTSGTLVANML
jgi:hypothetical protein